MRVGDFFTLDEFQRSEAAARRGLPVVIPPDYVPAVERLVRKVLDPLRASLVRPIVVLSGYRPPWLNKLVGGAPSSAHLEARAADIVVPGMTPLEVCLAIRRLDLPFDQLILEFGQWTHVAVPREDERPRWQSLEAVKVSGRTVYAPLRLEG